MISNFYLRREFYNNSAESVKDTIDIDSMNTKELYKEAKQYADHLAEVLKIEYISNSNRDFLYLFKKTKAQIYSKTLPNSYQFLSSRGSKYRNLPTVEQTEAELDALYTVSSSPSRAQSEEQDMLSQYNNSDDFQELPPTPLYISKHSPKQQYSTLSVNHDESVSALQLLPRIAPLREDNKDLPDSQPVYNYQSRTGREIIPSRRKREEDLLPNKHLRLDKSGSKFIPSTMFYSRK